MNASLWWGGYTGAGEKWEPVREVTGQKWPGLEGARAEVLPPRPASLPTSLEQLTTGSNALAYHVEVIVRERRMVGGGEEITTRRLFQEAGGSVLVARGALSWARPTSRAAPRSCL
jgi:hypothetical protein